MKTRSYTKKLQNEIYKIPIISSIKKKSIYKKKKIPKKIKEEVWTSNFNKIFESHSFLDLILPQKMFPLT